MQSYNPAILGYTFSRLLNGHLAYKQEKCWQTTLVIDALLHSLAALAATSSAVAFYRPFAASHSRGTKPPRWKASRTGTRQTKDIHNMK